jgi:hypothetical protein
MHLGQRGAYAARVFSNPTGAWVKRHQWGLTELLICGNIDNKNKNESRWHQLFYSELLCELWTPRYITIGFRTSLSPL